MPPGQKLVSYDVSALFTSVPVDQALTVIREKLHEDTTLKQRCQLNVEQVIELLGLCLNTTYFVHNNKFYQQTHGAAMGSPVSPIVCNLYMENFEKIALSSAPSPPSMWLRYVDDTFVKIHEYDVDGFTAHINSIDRNIQFTTEPELNNKLPFLDLCIHVIEDGGTKITIYRKPAHTDQYLNFSSNHPLEHKRSVVRTLTHRAKEFVTTSEDQECKLKHVHNALRMNTYTEWALVIPKQKAKTRPTSTNKGNVHQTSLHWPTVCARFIRNTVKNIQTTRCQCVPQTCEHSTFHPRTPERQDAERQEAWGHIRDNMRSGPCTRVHR